MFLSPPSRQIHEFIFSNQAFRQHNKVHKLQWLTKSFSYIRSHNTRRHKLQSLLSFPINMNKTSKRGGRGKTMQWFSSTYKQIRASKWVSQGIQRDFLAGASILLWIINGHVAWMPMDKAYSLCKTDWYLTTAHTKTPDPKDLHNVTQWRLTQVQWTIWLNQVPDHGQLWEGTSSWLPLQMIKIKLK